MQLDIRERERQNEAELRSDLWAVSRAEERISPAYTPVYPTLIGGTGVPIRFFFIIPEEDAKCRAHQGHEAVCLRSIGPPLPHLSFFSIPRLYPLVVTVYSVWIGRSYCETRPGFPHSARPRFVVPGEALKPPGLRWHCPRPPGDSAQACSLSSTPAAISQPPPSSRPSAFSAARLPSPRYGFARSAPLRSASLRVASRGSAVPNFSSRIPCLLRISRDNPLVLLLSLFLSSTAALLRILCGDKTPQLLLPQARTNFTLLTRHRHLPYLPTGG